MATVGKKSKSIFNILDKNKNGRVTQAEANKGSRGAGNARIVKIDPLLAMQMRHRKLKLSNKNNKPNKSGVSLSELDKIIMIRKKHGISAKRKIIKRKLGDTPLDDRENQVNLVRTARKNFRKKTSLKAQLKRNALIFR